MNKDTMLGDEGAAEVEAAPLPPDAALKNIATLADSLVNADAAIVEATQALEKLNAIRKRLSEVDLPNALTQAGVESFTLTGGARVEVKVAVRCGITDAHRPAAHAWLEQHGHESLIKRTFTILFGRDQLAWARKFERDCAKRKVPLNVKRAEKVESQTLGAFVRKEREAASRDGRDPNAAVPADLFGVYVQRYASVTPPK